jgi:hypothetical protein
MATTQLNLKEYLLSILDQSNLSPTEQEAVRKQAKENEVKTLEEMVLKYLANANLSEEDKNDIKDKNDTKKGKEKGKTQNAAPSKPKGRSI